MSKRLVVTMNPNQERRLRQLCLNFGDTKTQVVHRALDILYFASNSDQAAYLIEYIKTLKDKK